MRIGGVRTPFVLAALWDSCLAVPLADRPHGDWMFRSELDLFRFMSDHKAVALEQGVFHVVRTDFDLQHLAAVRHGKPKRGISSGARRGQNDNVPSWSRIPARP
jgi:hypothetical protein